MRKARWLFLITMLFCLFGKVSSQIPENWSFPPKYAPLIESLADRLPDLDSIRIKVKEKPIGTTMATRPSFFFFFQKTGEKDLCVVRK